MTQTVPEHRADRAARKYCAEVQRYWIGWSRLTFLVVTLSAIVVPVVLYNVFRSELDSPGVALLVRGLFWLLMAAVLYVIVTYAVANRSN